MSYGIAFWEIGAHCLCPAIPSRQAYLEEAVELALRNRATLDAWLTAHQQKCALDVGTGEGLIYPLLGYARFRIRFVATDLAADSLRNCEKILAANSALAGKITLRLQQNAQQVLRGVVEPQDRFIFTVCNPPFYAHEHEIGELDWRDAQMKPNESLTSDGDYGFIRTLLTESREFAHQALIFSSLIGKGSTFK